jgi:hypothetical protein
VVLVHIIAWVYGWVVQEKYTKNPPMLDWADKGFVEGFFVVMLWSEPPNEVRTYFDPKLISLVIGFSQQAAQNFLYYLLSTMTDNISELCKLRTRRCISRLLI